MNEAAKRRAAEAAVAYVESGMRLGLGTGSTAGIVAELLGQALQAGRLKDLVGVPTSPATAAIAARWGLPLADLTTLARLDLAIDGADEVDPALDLIKGHGGALLYEKIVASQAERFIVVVDGSKRVQRLGATKAVPVEVVPFALPAVARTLAGWGATVSVRQGEQGPYVTQAGHQILDAAFGLIADAASLADRLDGLVGVVEHGLFVGFAERVLVAEADEVLTLTRETP